MRRLVEAVLNGASRGAARKAAGIAATTFYDWLAKGKAASSGPYYEMRLALQNADAEVEERMVQCVLDSAPEDWRAAAWWLERCRPKRYNRRAPLVAVVAKDKEIVDPKKLEELRRSIEAAVAGKTGRHHPP